MKTILLAAALLTIGHLSIAQNDFPIPINSDVTVDGGSINFKRPVTSGGWARGLFFYDHVANSDRWAGIGMYGGANGPKDLYLGHGISPWASSEGLHINDNGNVGVGVRFPTQRFEVDGTSLFRNTTYYGTDTNNKIGIVSYNNTQDLFLIRAAAGHKLSLGANNTNNRMVIDLDGKVGIGTSSPEHKLHLKNTTSSYVRKGEIRFEVGYYGFPEGGTDKPNWIQSSYYNNSNWDLGIGGDDYNGKEPLMMIKGDGRVGIGITSPDANLDVRGASESNLRLSTQNPGYYLTLDANEDAGNRFDLKIAGQEIIGSKTLNGVSPTYVNGYYGLALSAGTTSVANNNVGLFVATNGHVGVGTFTPSATDNLHVVGGARVDSYLTLGANGASGHTASGVILESHNDYRGTGTFSQGQTAEWFWGNPYTDHDGTFIIARGPQGTGTALAQKANALLTLTDAGNVSIGTTDVYSGYKLSVEGKIQTDEVKVHPETQWMDIVFEEDYDLRSLEEVKKYIDENGHLPDIPSAEEVEENGFNLGEMDANLLRKIEELTLYMLEKDKAIKALENTNATLIHRLEQLEKRMQD